MAVSWPDVVTAEFSTGVPNVEVYSELGWPVRAGYLASSLAMGVTGAGAWRLAGQALGRLTPEAPTGAARQKAGYVMVAEALDAWRRPRRMRMHTFDGYTTSVITAAAAVRRVLAGEVKPGFQTPSTLFGAEFILDAGAAVLEGAQGVQAGAA